MLSISSALPLAASADSTDWIPPVPLPILAKAKAPLIPFPREVKWSRDNWQIGVRTQIVYPRAQSAELAIAAQKLQGYFATQGLKVAVKSLDGELPDNAHFIRLSIEKDATPKAEGYKLTVNGDGVALRGNDVAGVFYGVQTLRQMLRIHGNIAEVQHAEIRDWPAFAIRGFMHDTGRNFQTAESLKAQLDRFADYKLNVFHWHLADHPGWRVESRAFPILNDPQHQSRDKGAFYTYDQIRDVMRYARERHITIIPELDMPGHSDYFDRAFGFGMSSPQGMEVLEKLIAEFCDEIPADLSPYFHLGADEVHISNAQEFMERMLRAVRAQNRQPMVWNPGLKPDLQTVLQNWNDEEGTPFENPENNRFVDSGGTYLNLYDPLLIVQRLFFRQPAQQAQGDDRALGAILCLWPDTRVDDKAKIFRHNALWPGVLAFSEAIWQGRPRHAPDYLSVQPAEGTAEAKSYAEFESRIAAHRDRCFANEPFPLVKTSHLAWSVVGPFPRTKEMQGDFPFEPEKEIRESYDINGQTLSWQTVRGGTVMLSSPENDGVLSTRDISTAYALTYLYSDKPRGIHAWLGFETSSRSSRQAGGIPRQGQWDAFGAQVWINDAPQPAPHWQNPGTNQHLSPTYSSPANEIPFEDEEFYWTREPSKIQLKAGWNKVLIRTPFAYDGQRWSYSFIPVRQQGGRWIEDESVISAARRR
jgi:hypothetical protein